MLRVGRTLEQGSSSLDDQAESRWAVGDLPLHRVPDYRRGWLLGLLTGVIRWLEFLALGIFAYQLTESPPLVALLAIVRVAPYAFLGFVIGALTDRYDRRVMLIGLLAVMALIAGTMVFLAHGGLATYPMVVAATLATGIFWVTDMPIRRRFMVEAIGQARIGRGMGLDNITNYLTRGLGPLIGGLVLQFFGVVGVFTLNCVLYVICIVLAVGFTRPRRASPVSGAAAGARESLMVLLGNARFMVILGVTVVYNLFCAPFIAMIPVFAQKDFGFSPAAIGSIAAMEGLGGVIGSILIGLFIRPRALLAIYFTGPFIYLVSVLVLSFFLRPEFTVAGLILASFGGACFSATQYALVYTTAPEELRGRAFGLLALAIGCATIGLWNAGNLFAAYPSDVALRTMALEGLVPLMVLGGAALWTRPPTHEAPGPDRA
jgi:MFS family permease